MRPYGFVHGLALAGALCGACSTAGSNWMAQPRYQSDDAWEEDLAPTDVMALAGAGGRRRLPPARQVVTLSSDPRPQPLAPIDSDPPGRSFSSIRGRVLGTFKNTYYDFPNEGDFEGDGVALMDSQCRRIKTVPRGFFESVCVQGSGMLSSGTPVSFNRRDCSCAERCPRTGQKICFDALDPASFPWGRGATGQSISPLLTVAADPDVLPMGTGIYIPEYDGLPRDPSHSGKHDGCFLVQDRGLKVKGRHVDVFTGDPAITRLWNELVPSNRGVTVVLDHPRCARAQAEQLVVRPADQ